MRRVLSLRRVSLSRRSERDGGRGMGGEVDMAEQGVEGKKEREGDGGMYMSDR